MSYTIQPIHGEGTLKFHSQNKSTDATDTPTFTPPIATANDPQTNYSRPTSLTGQFVREIDKLILETAIDLALYEAMQGPKTFPNYGAWIQSIHNHVADIKTAFNDAFNNAEK